VEGDANRVLPTWEVAASPDHPDYEFVTSGIRLTMTSTSV